MKTKQTANELIIRETPGCLWIFGLFFASIGGIIVYGALGGFSNWSEIPFWQLAMAFFMGAIADRAGIATAYYAPIICYVVIFLFAYKFYKVKH